MNQKSSAAPKHVGIILDGNRRWAKKQGIPTLEGHRRGAEVFKEISLAAFERGVQYLSAFVFSTENWRRTEEEVSYLMRLVVKAVERYLEEFHKQGIRIITIGQLNQLSPSVLKAIQKTQDKTKDNKKGTLVLCFNYGGHQEIVDAAKKILAENLTPSDLTIDLFEQNLYAPEVPAVDLLIRTSGEQRTSGFMLWRAAYAELFISDKLWPDYTVEDLDEAIHDFYKRQRRFGG